MSQVIIMELIEIEQLLNDAQAKLHANFKDPIAETVTDEFAQFHASELHTIMWAIFVKTRHIDIEELKTALDLLNDSYDVWKNTLQSRALQQRTSKIVGSGAGLALGTGILLSFPVVAATGFVGVCGSACLYVWNHVYRDKQEKNAYDNYDETINFMRKTIQKTMDTRSASQTVDSYTRIPWHFAERNLEPITERDEMRAFIDSALMINE